MHTYMVDYDSKTVEAVRTIWMLCKTIAWKYAEEFNCGMNENI